MNNHKYTVYKFLVFVVCVSFLNEFQAKKKRVSSASAKIMEALESATTLKQYTKALNQEMALKETNKQKVKTIAAAIDDVYSTLKNALEEAQLAATTAENNEANPTTCMEHNYCVITVPASSGKILAE